MGCSLQQAGSIEMSRAHVSKELPSTVPPFEFNYVLNIFDILEGALKRAIDLHQIGRCDRKRSSPWHLVALRSACHRSIYRR
jgi:hypothetical protein